MKRIAKRVILSLGVIFLILTSLYFATSRPGQMLDFSDPYHQSRAAAEGENIMVATGHPYATAAALNILQQGGNAADAAIAALLVLNVTQGEEASFPGVAPLLYYDSKTKKVHSYIGAGKAPARATIDYFKSRGYDTVPLFKYASQLVPASPDVIVALLKKFGTKSFAAVSAPAIRIAEEGFPVHKILMRNLNMGVIKRLGFRFLLPYNAEIYMKDKWWKPLHHREKFNRPVLAATFRELVLAEKNAVASGKNREQGLDAVRDFFYRGPIAAKIVKAHAEHDGTITSEDLSGYTGAWEEPLSVTYGPYTIFSNQTWNQGGVALLALQILEGVDLKSMGHNSAKYIHTVIQAIELAMADRESYFGDPAFVQVPVKGLLSKKYAAERRKLFSERAFGKTPPAGDPQKYEGASGVKSAGVLRQAGESFAMLPPTENAMALGFWEQTAGRLGRDTTYLSIIDGEGNSISLTPSDFPQSPIIAGDITMGIRMTQFRLDPKHPSSLKPGKRPTITPNALMAFKDGKFWMAFGTPGGDMQTQASLQVFLNLVVFGMDVQQAVEAPRFRSLNWPDAFSPHAYFPGVIELEEELMPQAEALSQIGYSVKGRGKYEYDFGAPCISMKDAKTGKLLGGADPRKESWAEGR